MTRILVAVDGSSHSAKVATAVVEHGMGAVSGMLLGSVATKTVHLARCPVVLIRE